MPCWWVLTRTEQLSMAATAGGIWLCACVRYWPYRGVGSVCFSSWLWSTSVSLCTFALFLVDSILTPWRGSIQKSIARVQAHFSTLDVGSAAKIIFPEFAQVSLHSGYVFGRVFYFLSVDLRGTSVSYDQSRIWLGAWGQYGVGCPGRIFLLIKPFLPHFMDFLPICYYEPVFKSVFFVRC